MVIAEHILTCHTARGGKAQAREALEDIRAHAPGIGIPAEKVLKAYEGRPNTVDLIVSGQVQLLINTPFGKLTQADDYAMRRAALQHGVPYTTTMSAANAACDAIIAMRSRVGEVRPLQEWYDLARSLAAEPA